MHSFVNTRIQIYYNSDFSGDCTIHDKESNNRISMKMSDLLEFIAHAKKSILIEEIENSSPSDILGIKIQR